MKFNRIYRDAGAASSGGRSPLPSLADLDNPPATTTDPVEGVDADGNLLEGYEKLEDGTIKKIEKSDDDPDANRQKNDPPADPPADDSEEDEEPTAEEFFNAVKAQTGFEVEVNYGEVDPLSPEGIAIRDLELVKSTRAQFEDELKAKYPRAYAYFLHHQQGGADDEFFKEPEPAVLAREVFEADPDAQEAWIRKDLSKKGLSDAIIDLQVKEYITQGKLAENALKVYDRVVQEDKKRLADIQAKADADQKAFESNVKSLTTEIRTSVVSGMKSLVPETKKEEFIDFVMQRIQHDGQNNFFAILPLEKEHLASTMDSLFLQYVKGDLSQIVEKESKVKTVQRLRLRAKESNVDSKRGTKDDTQNKKFIPLSEI